MPTQWTKASLAKTIDHTLLKANAAAEQLRELCAEARKFGFASICVNPAWAGLCARELAGSGIMVCAVVGFPLGANATATKAAEASEAARDGADEVDMVINLGWAKSGDWRAVEEDIRAVTAAIPGTPVKVIIETCYLTNAEKAKACEAAARAGARCVQTSTGFGTGGATVEDVRLMRKAVGDKGLSVKASGGIRSYHEAILLLEAGADRIGASSGVVIVSELPE